jgi:hypothetical protein
MVDLTIPAIALACFVFLIISWNMLLPISGAKNVDFLNYMAHIIADQFKNNINSSNNHPQLQQFNKMPIINLNTTSSSTTKHN